MPTWTEPVDFNSGSPLLASQLNLMQENLRSLREDNSVIVPLTDDFALAGGGIWYGFDPSTAFNFTASGRNILVIYRGEEARTTTTRLCFDVEVDGVRWSGQADGLIREQGVTDPVFFAHVLTGISAGVHTIELVYKSVGGGAPQHFATNETEGMFAVMDI